MSEKKVGKRLLTWVLVLVMTLSLLPLNVLAAGGPETDSSSGMNFTKELLPDQPDDDGNYTIRMTAQATGKTTTTDKAVPMDIVLVLDQSGSMKDSFGDGTRQSAMKEAVNSFIGEVAKKYSTNADHHMAIVTFGSNADTLAEWTEVNAAGESKLKNAINDLPSKPKGATNVGAGMTETQSLMRSAPTGENRQKTVIVFTDGVPTTQSDFDTDVANTAISAAKSMKAADVTIYTVGIFKGADPKQLHGDKWSYVTENDVPCSGEPGSYWGGSWLEHLFGGNDFAPIDVPAGNRFLNYLSSNSANASEIGITKDKYNPGNVFGGRGDGWRIDNNADCTTNKGYYMTASDASSLKNIFKVVSDTVPEPVNDKLDENTVITDMLSDYFTFADTADDVKVYAEKPDGTTHPIVLPEGPNGIDVNGKTVTVTGYDFSAHYKGIGDAEETLVIEIKVKPDPTATWGASGNYDTNKGDATVTLPNSEANPIAEAKSPKVYVDTYKVTYKPGNGTGDDYTDQYYLNGATTKVKANTFTAPDGYEFDCWKDENDNSYKVDDEITFDKSDVVLTAQWKQSKYTVTYELDGGKINGNDSYTDSNSPYAKDTTVAVAPNPTKEGYTFADWTVTKPETTPPVINTDETTGKKTFTMPAANVTLTAQWTVNEYTLSYDTKGGTIKDNAVYTKAGKVAFDTKLDTPAAADMTREGYTFGGWYSDAALTDPAPTTMPAENLTLYAKWTPNTDTQYTVEYYYQNADGTYPATASETAHRTGTTGTLASVTTEDKADKESGKYTYDSSAAANVESGMIAADGSLTLKLYFKLSKFDYTIKYYYEGQSTPFDQKIVNVTYGTEVSKVDDSSNLNPHYSRKSVTPNLPVTIDEADIVIEVTYAKDPVGDGTFDFNDVVSGNDKVTPAITKTVKGNVGKNFNETFAVTVKGADENSKATMATASYTGKAKVTYSDLKDIAFQFAENDKLTFRNDGNYTYTVREIPGGTSRMSYDTTEYTLTINVVLDADSNTYKVESWQFTAGNREYAPLNIVNTYRTYHPSTPSKPTVEIEDDDALGLNTTDHFAYIVGYGNGEVRPQNNITRAEVATIFFRLLTDDVRDENLTKTNRYSDVASTSWYNTAVSTLSSMGIITGYPDGTFRPNAAITRAEFAAIAARFDNDGDKTAAKFSDIANHWAKDEISIAYNNGWINGYPDGTFGPQRDITRAETMTLVNRVLNRQPETADDLLPDMVTWTDNADKNAWYYLAVQEATNSHYYEFKTNSQYEKWTELRETRDWTLLEK